MILSDSTGWKYCVCDQAWLQLFNFIWRGDFRGGFGHGGSRKRCKVDVSAVRRLWVRRKWDGEFDLNQPRSNLIAKRMCGVST